MQSSEALTKYLERFEVAPMAAKMLTSLAAQHPEAVNRELSKALRENKAISNWQTFAAEVLKPSEETSGDEPQTLAEG